MVNSCLINNYYIVEMGLANNANKGEVSYRRYLIIKAMNKS